MTTTLTLTSHRDTSFPVPIRSTWRDPVGPLLTDRRIAYWEKEGYYGAETKRRALRLKEQKAEQTLRRINREKQERKLARRREMEYV